jgi:hypothetical protein
MSHDSRESPFWRSAGARLLLVLLAGWLSVLWFQGCLVPSARDEVLQNQQKAADGGLPPR